MCSLKIGVTKDFAILPIGSLPGRNEQICQEDPLPDIKPLCNEGIKPDFTKEDLPLPDEPITAINLDVRSLVNNSSVCFSLPKNNMSSSSSKARSPGNGLFI